MMELTQSRCGLPRLSTFWSSYLAACSALLVSEKQHKVMLLKQRDLQLVVQSAVAVHHIAKSHIH